MPAESLELHWRQFSSTFWEEIFVKRDVEVSVLFHFVSVKTGSQYAAKAGLKLYIPDLLT